MSTADLIHLPPGGKSDDELFLRIAEDLFAKGYSINPAALPLALADLLYHQISRIDDDGFSRAGIGRDQQHMLNSFVRSDEICWITGASAAGQLWLEWAQRLQVFLNRRLFLGLFSFESHFSHYAPGDYYKRHCDAFKGEANRVLSLVVYLNHDWQPDDGGELVLYLGDEDNQGLRVTPGFATIVVFLSEEFPHEVLKSSRDRYAIAGWFRVNGSTSERVDPPV